MRSAVHCGGQAHAVRLHAELEEQAVQSVHMPSPRLEERVIISAGNSSRSLTSRMSPTLMFFQMSCTNLPARSTSVCAHSGQVQAVVAGGVGERRAIGALTDGGGWWQERTGLLSMVRSALCRP